MKRSLFALFLSFLCLAVFSCVNAPSLTAPGGATVSNVFSYTSYQDPVIRAFASVPAYPMICALLDANSNIIYQFSLFYTNATGQQVIRPGTYYPGYSPWTNVGNIFYPCPWRVTNAVTLNSGTYYRMTISTFASNTNDFAVSFEKTVLTVELDPNYL